MQLKKIITTVRIRLEGWDKYQIVAYIVGFHMICNMPIFKNFKFQGHSKYFWKLNFPKTHLFKILKKSPNCSLSWHHIWKVSFWDLNGIIFFAIFFYNIPKWNESTLIKSCNFHSKFKFAWTKSTAAFKQRTSLLLRQNKLTWGGGGDGHLKSLFYNKFSCLLQDNF